MHKQNTIKTFNISIGCETIQPHWQQTNISYPLKKNSKSKTQIFSEPEKVCSCKRSYEWNNFNKYKITTHQLNIIMVPLKGCILSRNKYFIMVIGNSNNHTKWQGINWYIENLTIQHLNSRASKCYIHNILDFKISST